MCKWVATISLMTDYLSLANRLPGTAKRAAYAIDLSSNPQPWESVSAP